jgi:hypothetical protein
MIRLAGFFDEFKIISPSGLSLKHNIRNQPHTEEDKIINYLTSGEYIIVNLCFEIDILSEKRKYSGSRSIMTDGVWVWTNFLSYYVKEYHAVLSDEFIQHMKSNNWKMPWFLKFPLINYYKLRKVCLEYCNLEKNSQI